MAVTDKWLTMRDLLAWYEEWPELLDLPVDVVVNCQHRPTCGHPYARITEITRHVDESITLAGDCSK